MTRDAMPCPACERAKTNPFTGLSMVGCHGCEVRELANAPERIRRHAYLSLRANGTHDEADALRAEVEAEEKRLRAARLKRCTG